MLPFNLPVRERPGRRLWLALLLASVVLAAGWTTWQWARKPATTQYNWVAVDTGPIAGSFVFGGEVSYRDQVRLSSQVLGTIAGIHVKVGETVKPGQLLITLDDTAQRAEWTRAKAQAAHAQIDTLRLEHEVTLRQAEWVRAKELWDLRLAGRERLDAAQLALDNVKFLQEASRKVAEQEQALVAQRLRDLARTEVRSPIAGTVISLALKTGETAVPSVQGIAGSELCVVAALGSVEVHAMVSEHDISRFSLGAQAMVTAVTVADRRIAGKVVEIGRMALPPEGVGAKSGSARKIAVRIALTDAPASLIAGTSAEVSLQSAALPGVLRVPLSALQFDEESPLASMDALELGPRRVVYVWKQVQGEPVRQEVRLGAASVTHQQVLSGLTAEDRILTGPPALLARLNREGAGR